MLDSKAICEQVARIEPVAVSGNFKTAPTAIFISLCLVDSGFVGRPKLGKSGCCIFFSVIYLLYIDLLINFDAQRYIIYRLLSTDRVRFYLTFNIN